MEDDVWQVKDIFDKYGMAEGDLIVGILEEKIIKKRAFSVLLKANMTLGTSEHHLSELETQSSGFNLGFNSRVVDANV